MNLAEAFEVQVNPTQVGKAGGGGAGPQWPHLICALLDLCALPVHKSALFRDQLPMLSAHSPAKWVRSWSCCLRTSFQSSGCCVGSPDTSRTSHSILLRDATLVPAYASPWSQKLILSWAELSPVAAGGVGADERLCVFELLLHISDALPTVSALEGCQV